MAVAHAGGQLSIRHFRDYCITADISNDNPFSEPLFRTGIYRPVYLAQDIATPEGACTRVLAFVRWDNDEHRQSGIRFVTPTARHAGHDRAILRQRQVLYEEDWLRHPERWSRQTRSWTPVGMVWLNPDTRAMAETSHAESAAWVAATTRLTNTGKEGLLR